jgi:hypothetical protein
MDYTQSQAGDTQSHEDANRDPLTGLHPLGARSGTASGGAAAGAAASMAGKSFAGSIDPTREATFWRENFKSRFYAKGGASFADYEPAYDYGVAAYASYPGRRFDDVEVDLSRAWDSARGKSRLGWDTARIPIRDAWDRVANAGARVRDNN